MAESVKHGSDADLVEALQSGDSALLASRDFENQSAELTITRLRAANHANARPQLPALLRYRR